MIRYLSFWNCLVPDPDKSELAYRLNLRFQALIPVCPGLLRTQVTLTRPGSTHELLVCLEFSDQDALDVYHFNGRHLSLRAETGRLLTDHVFVTVEIPE